MPPLKIVCHGYKPGDKKEEEMIIMKQKLKKIMAMALSLAISTSIFATIPGTEAKAFVQREKVYSDIEIGTTVQGEGDKDNYFRFTMKNSGRLNINLNIDALWAEDGTGIFLGERDGDIWTNQIWYNAAPLSSLTVGSNYLYVDLLKGDYYLRIVENGFSFTLTTDDAKETFSESYDSQNYNEGTAKKVSLKKKVKGSIAINENYGDFYKVKLPSKGNLKITANNKSEKLIVDVYRLGSQPVKLDLIKGKNVNTVEIDKKGTYYVVFRGDRTTGNYDFNLKFTKKK